jgi:hypothetical protein
LILLCSLDRLLQRLLSLVLDEDWGLAKIGRETIFIAHSLGGIIVKQALVAASKTFEDVHRTSLDSTFGIVFLGTPHRSEDIARVLAYAAHVGEAQLESKSSEVSRHSVASLQALQQNFEDLHDQGVLDIQITSFYEELPVPGFGRVIEAHILGACRTDTDRLSTNPRGCYRILRVCHYTPTTR